MVLTEKRTKEIDTIIENHIAKLGTRDAISCFSDIKEITDAELYAYWNNENAKYHW